jgi:hypothetical protein
MNLSSARKASEFARAERGHGAVTWKAYVPGHCGRRYMVLFRHETRIQNGLQVMVLTGECLVDAGRLGETVCPSRHNGNPPCYHVRAGIVAVCKENKQRVSFCKNEQDARTLVNIGGKAFRYGRHDSDKFFWAVQFPGGK